MILRTVGGRPDLPYQAWRKDVHSQSGEDGIIEHLLGAIQCRSGYFVEFGAWDGRHLSNSARLADEGWAGCFIEGSAERFQDLLRNYADNDKIYKLNAFVEGVGENCLDNLLDIAKAPTEFEVLSIDIDGNDYHVWNGLVRHRAKLVVVEFNPSIPAHVIYVQDDDPSINRGASLAALTELAQEKGYDLVAATDWNAFFLQKSLIDDFAIPTYTPAQVKNPEYEAAIFHGFDGTLLVAGKRELIWHGIEYDAEELQLLPPSLRRIPIAQDVAYFEELQEFIARRRSARQD